ncbi:WecB/TagA/CpsF family glycosyltransferase [Pseudooctadecabacter jejudonensis]|uniref:UDP-N-acetylgalactosamine-undecaprenyl-phosphate N-acetylgalactosaminephosphotransferase n=1 Tax=Pseudooctadecabacter jejudonensis TaxID=1391910 RepID=A0A1Y5RWK3_9RHOB|nr:WecB/TagA/CpsF family glycosyltransferase [Pseudooctadecabacter jejudonensis]SLN27259.1 UDP-N-acetylgalactosamine-undecaprenyl-phosphate N-acetylgalactosaminephosphotransferase [Pseudooctadecabacter jejudonensis]
MTFHSPFTGTLAPIQALPVKYVPSLRVSLIDAPLDQTVDALLSPGRRRVAFMNAHCFNVMAQDPAYRAAIYSADVVLPDGSGVAMACKMSGVRLTANLNGTDLVPALIAKAAAQGKSVYLLGAKPGVAAKAALELTLRNPGLRVVGTLDGYGQARDEDAVIEDINASGADIVLVAMGVPMQDLWLHRNAHRLNANLTLGVGAAFDFLAGQVSRAPRGLRRLGGEWLWRLAMEPRRLAKRYLIGNVTFLARSARQAASQITMASVLRRTLDVAVAGTAAFLLAPLFAATAIAIKLDSRGPVFFRQTRVGQDGREFPMLKFRSMHQDAEARRADLLASSDRDGICFKSKSDPRITRVGRFIRRFSIDELPQIFNVLRTDMSIVGPRPALPCEVAAYPARALGRLSVKPGITGVWQVSGRANIGFDRMIDMDLAYAKSRTLLLDLILIFMTFRAVLSGRGAH